MAEETLILFHSEEIAFQLDAEEVIRKWLQNIIHQEGAKHRYINYVFMSDEALLAKNIEFLNHDYYTDILSFQMNDDPIEGDIFISIDRVADNAKTIGVDFESELIRVIAHGILHFIGYKDKSSEEIKLMRDKEDHYLVQYLKEYANQDEGFS